MRSKLIDLEQRALALMNKGQKREAAELLAAIIKEQPDWEHGETLYSLACCYEDLGESEAARECYSRALQYEPKNPYFLGGFASFLYRYGHPEEALEAHINLLRTERDKSQPDGEAIRSIMLALESLGKKLGLNAQDLAKRIGGA